MDVPRGSMPGIVGPENSTPPWSSDSCERARPASSASRASVDRARSRERSRVPAPPGHLPFTQMAGLNNLSREQRYYHYVQCPVQSCVLTQIVSM